MEPICFLIGGSILLSTGPMYLSYFNSKWKRLKRFLYRNKYSYTMISKDQTFTFYILCAYLNEYCSSNMYETVSIDYLSKDEKYKQIYKIPAPNTCIKFFNKDKNIDIEIIAKSLDKINVNAFEIIVKKKFENVLHNELKPLYMLAGYDVLCIKRILNKATFTNKENNLIVQVEEQNQKLQMLYINNLHKRLEDRIQENNHLINEQTKQTITDLKDLSDSEDDKEVIPSYESEGEFIPFYEESINSPN